jgi:hypothetical protein
MNILVIRSKYNDLKKHQKLQEYTDFIDRMKRNLRSKEYDSLQTHLVIASMHKGVKRQEMLNKIQEFIDEFTKERVRSSKSIRNLKLPQHKFNRITRRRGPTMATIREGSNESPNESVWRTVNPKQNTKKNTWFFGWF